MSNHQSKNVNIRAATAFTMLQAHGWRLKLVKGLHCPGCYRPLQVYDAELRADHALKVICAGCHRDILIFEREDR